MISKVDLLAPNLNKEKATYVMAMQREAQKKASQEKKDRDRAALEKQRSVAGLSAQNIPSLTGLL